MTEPIGITHKELIEMMLNTGIHCPVDRFKRLAIELQQRALANAALDRMTANAEELGLYDAPKCWCQTCRPITLTDMRMVLCPTCGNKRCPHATDHRLVCTNSNDPGQIGSKYGIPLEETK